MKTFFFSFFNNILTIKYDKNTQCCSSDSVILLFFIVFLQVGAP